MQTYGKKMVKQPIAYKKLSLPLNLHKTQLLDGVFLTLFYLYLIFSIK